MTKPKPRKRSRRLPPIVLDSRLVEFDGGTIRCLPDAVKWWEDEPEIAGQKSSSVTDKLSCRSPVRGNLESSGNYDL